MLKIKSSWTLLMHLSSIIYLNNNFKFTRIHKRMRKVILKHFLFRDQPVKSSEKFRAWYIIWDISARRLRRDVLAGIRRIPSEISWIRHRKSLTLLLSRQRKMERVRMDKSPVRKNGRRREKDRFKEGTNQVEVGVLQEALIEKNHFEESLNLPEYPRNPSMVVASDSVGKHCEKRRASEKRIRG